MPLLAAAPVVDHALPFQCATVPFAPTAQTSAGPLPQTPSRSFPCGSGSVQDQPGQLPSRLAPSASAGNVCKGQPRVRGPRDSRWGHRTGGRPGAGIARVAKQDALWHAATMGKAKARTAGDANRERRVTGIRRFTSSPVKASSRPAGSARNSAVRDPPGCAKERQTRSDCLARPRRHFRTIQVALPTASSAPSSA